MSDILLSVIIVLVGLIVTDLIIAYLQKPEFAVVREAHFRSPPASIFYQINNFRNWSGWNPWEKMDPNLVRAYSGQNEGVGAKYAWRGNIKVGEGKMEITHSTPFASVQLDLHFIKPFKATNITEFTLTPSNGGTRMKWEMRGNRSYVMRLFGFVLNMDKLVGGDFEKGFANLKTVLGE